MRNNESRGCRCGHSCSTAAADSGDRRRGHAKARINLRKPIAQGTDFHLWHAGMRKDSKALVLAAFFGYFLSLVTESTPAGGIYRHKGCAGRNPPATALPWPWGRELRIAAGTSCPRNDKGFCKECGCIIDGAVGGQPQGSPQRKIRVIFRDLLRGLIAGISPGGAVV